MTLDDLKSGDVFTQKDGIYMVLEHGTDNSIKYALLYTSSFRHDPPVIWFDIDRGSFDSESLGLLFNIRDLGIKISEKLK